MSTETLQWTLLVGLLAMVVYVLWHRMRASFVEGVAPTVAADWEGEAVTRVDGGAKVSVRVRRPGEVRVSLEEQGGRVMVLHDGHLDAGVHEWAIQLPTEGTWFVKLSCPGHRSERRL
jgi:hypothetical protein